jgi:predicted metal-dependent hydrolase
MQRAIKRRSFKSNRDSPDELRHWSFTRQQIGDKLKKYYQAYMTEELSPRLLAALKKLDEEQPNTSVEHVQVIGQKD